jgi:hypothetical protein
MLLFGDNNFLSFLFEQTGKNHGHDALHQTADAGGQGKKLNRRAPTIDFAHLLPNHCNSWLHAASKQPLRVQKQTLRSSGLHSNKIVAIRKQQNWPLGRC